MDGLETYPAGRLYDREQVVEECAPQDLRCHSSFTLDVFRDKTAGYEGCRLMAPDT
jgi:hypothetical protein